MPATSTALENGIAEHLLSRAVVIHRPGQASVEHILLPALKPGDVLIRVEFEGVCATDLEILDGVLGYYADHVAEYPIVPGHEISGRVASLGTEVDGLDLGDPVVVECIQSCHQCESCRRGAYIQCTRRAELGVIGLNGGYSEYLVVPSRFVHRIPPTLDMRTACLCEPLAVALKGLHRLERFWSCSADGRSCAVVGVGPLGHLCARVLSRWGFSVTAFDQDHRRLDLCAQAGMSTSSDLSLLSRFEVLVEATGSQAALERVLLDSPAGAALLLLGLPFELAPFTFERIVGYDKVIVGSVGSSATDFREALELLPDLDTQSFTQNVLPLKAFQEGWELARRRECLKVLIRP